VYVGCHVSIRGGYLAAAKTALALGADAFQYFPKNPRSLTLKAFDPKDAEACRAFCREQGIVSIAHTSYPVNLAAAPGALYEAIADSLRNDLEIAESCGSIGVVVHFGQYKGADVLEGYRLMIRMVNDILDGWSGAAKLLIENNAGQGSRMGTTLEELTQVRQLLNHPEKVGFCFDTCHAFASGLWTGDDWEQVADRMRNLGYLDALAACSPQRFGVSGRLLSRQARADRAWCDRQGSVRLAAADTRTAGNSGRAGNAPSARRGPPGGNCPGATAGRAVTG